MTSVSHRILHNLKPTELAVKIEKASADPVNGIAKVVFTTNIPRRREADYINNVSAMERAFADVLGDKAHLVTASIHKTDFDGHYYAFIKMNTKTVEVEDAVKDHSGYTLVAANVFADAGDNIWEVREDASGKKVLVRNSIEDLTELFEKVAPVASMSVASASIRLSDNLEFASLVTFLDPVSEKFHHGVVLDTATVYDFTNKKAVEVNPSLAVAASDQVAGLRMEMSSLMGDNVSTFSEIAAANVQSLYDYLDQLYAHAPAFLAAYKDAISRYIKV